MKLNQINALTSWGDSNRHRPWIHDSFDSSDNRIKVFNIGGDTFLTVP